MSEAVKKIVAQHATAQATQITHASGQFSDNWPELQPPIEQPTTIVANPRIKAKENAAEIAKDILAAVGDLDEFPVHLNDVLVALYAPEKSKGGILYTDRSKDHEVYQSKAGLILKLGPGVDVDDHVVQFHGRELKIGDWVAFMPSEGWPVKIWGQQCRMVPDNRIRLGIPSPGAIY